MSDKTRFDDVGKGDGSIEGDAVRMICEMVSKQVELVKFALDPALINDNQLSHILAIRLSMTVLGNFIIHGATRDTEVFLAQTIATDLIEFVTRGKSFLNKQREHEE